MYIYLHKTKQKALKSGFRVNEIFYTEQFTSDNLFGVFYFLKYTAH